MFSVTQSYNKGCTDQLDTNNNHLINILNRSAVIGKLEVAYVHFWNTRSGNWSATSQQSSNWAWTVNILIRCMGAYLSFLRSPMGTGLTEIRGKVEMEPWDWLLAKEEVSRLSGDCGGVMRLGLLHSECEREPGFRGRWAETDGIRVCAV